MVGDIISKFNVTVTGEGRQPMLFTHGLGCDQNMWRFVTPAFEKDYKIVLFDIMGSGKSDLSFFTKEKYSGLQGYADDLVEIVEGLGLKGTILVAHSVGAMIGLLAAVSKPAIFSKIIMIGPSPCYQNDKDYCGGFEKKEIEDLLQVMKTNFGLWASSFATIAIGADNKTEFSDELRASFCKSDPDILYHFAAVTFWSDCRKDLPGLKTPTLIVQSAEDIIAPVEVGEYLQKNIEGSTLYVTKTSGHCPHLTAPNEVIKVIKQYLSGTNPD